MYKRPLSRNRSNHPYPFSAYILKSYSTQHSNKISAKEAYETASAKSSIKHVNQYLNVLELNSKIQKHPLTISPVVELPIPEINLKKHPHSEKVKISVEQSEIPSPNHRISNHRIKMKSLSPVKKKRPIDNPKISSYLRYQLVSLFSLVGRREDYMNNLKGKFDLHVTPLKNNELDQTFLKFEQSKGRDKGRIKFNYVTNQQLRSLKYKPKNTITSNNSSPNKKEDKEKVHYDEEDSVESEEAEQKQEFVDFPTWKRRNGVGYNQKVFIIKGGYAELRKSLLDRGWAENEDVWSPHYDFKWTTRICDINFVGLKHAQGVNHFNNNHHLTSKYGLTRRLRTLALGHGVDCDKFYPKCFDLGDQVDFQNFVENFKFSFAESITKRFLSDKKRYEGLELKIRIIYQILKRRTQSFSHLVNNINKGNFPTIKAQQWIIITQTSEFSEEEMKKKLLDIRKAQKEQFQLQNTEDADYENQLFQQIDEKIKKHIQILQERDPQFDINGMRNVWIAKPNFMSRGRGIRCFNNIYDIADYCLGLPTQFVVQKYIENPLLIEGRKFDIRQWVLVQDFNPPKIWFYEECYLRFSSDDFSLDNIYNRFVHLTNNSIQKKSKKHNSEKSMWEMKEFSDWLGAEKWKEVQEKIKNIVVWSIKSCEGHVIGKKGSMQLFGYDFMIDQNLNPWLIEVNMSPSMSYSTPVTRKLVKMVLQDTGKILSATKKGNNVGGFTCIYHGNEDLSKYDAFNI